jgi:hypothetical protein
MTYRQIKQAISTGLTSPPVTFDAELYGNTLVVITVSTNDGSFTNDARMGTAVEVYDATNDDIMRITYGVVPVGTSRTFTYTAFAGSTVNLTATEWPCTDTVSPLDKTASTSGTAPSTVTTINSGTTAATANGVETAVALTSLRADVSAESVNNGWTLLATSSGAFSDITAFTHLAATGAQNVDFTWTTSAVVTGAAVATFNAMGYVAPGNRGFDDLAGVALVISGRDDGKWDHAKSAEYWW